MQCETLASVDGTTFASQAIDAKYPNYRAMLDTEYEGIAANMVSAALISRIGEQCKALKKAGAGVMHSGASLLGVSGNEGIGFRLHGYEEQGLSIGGVMMTLRMSQEDVTATRDLSVLLA